MASALLSKSLDDMIKEDKKAGGGKGAKGGKGGKGKKPTPSAKPQGRQAGAARGRAAPVKAVEKVAPYQGGRGGRGGGGGVSRGPVIERKIVQGPPPKNRVFVTHIPYDWTDQDILGVMVTAGDVEKLTLFSDDCGRPTGNALVVYQTDSGAKKAVEDLDGAALGEQEISVTFARGSEGKPPAQQGGRGGGSSIKHAAPKGGKGSKGGKGGKGAKGAAKKVKTFGKAPAARGGKGGKRGPKSNAKIERKEVSRSQLDKELSKYAQ